MVSSMERRRMHVERTSVGYGGALSKQDSWMRGGPLLENEDFCLEQNRTGARGRCNSHPCQPGGGLSGIL